MQTNCEVISAFIDDEPFDADDLVGALATPEGRTFLIDAIALRGLTRSHDEVRPVTPSKFRIVRRLALAAAILLAASVAADFLWFDRPAKAGLHETDQAASS